MSPRRVPPTAPTETAVPAAQAAPITPCPAARVSGDPQDADAAPPQEVASQKPERPAAKTRDRGTENRETAAASPEQRLVRFLQAPPEQVAAIDRILTGGASPMHRPLDVPLLLGMGQAAAVIGVSRPTLWRMIRAGRLPKFEVLRGSFRIRRVDIEKFIGAGEWTR